MTAAPLIAGRRELKVGSLGLDAILDVPPDARGIVIFAHGSGSGRFSPRNNHVAGKMRDAGFATLLLDLLTAGEERDRRNVFDIALLAGRLRMARDWCAEYPATTALRPAYFGASTGAGAALRAAANDPRIAAIVSRGGRPDLAGATALAQVVAPTLLIVGGRDEPVIDLNRVALAAMRCQRELAIVPGAGHLFEEAGTLDGVVALAVGWLGRFIPGAAK
ncbi:dienelactone hydrolase family protein [Sphingopyxis sp.]|uniref:dienelactone hydrolase family protein n=1 Tax=Sphingopyxis sp. TaxID=1908224 RepID=UPI001D848EA4|nr:dienelactone hydrolase family protein [Sphingopyxis sp.]MBW8295164.1 dienelactone hydrolase family protein [Sphingopyxis sp.]